MSRACITCAGPITEGSKTGRCRSCAIKVLNSDPEVKAARLARLEAVRATEAFQAAQRAGCKRAGAERRADPVKLERMRELGRLYGAPNIVATQTPEARAKLGKAVQRTHLAWCPEEYWPMNVLLKRAGYRLPDRKAMIADEIKRKQAAAVAAERARLDAMTWEERVAEKLAKGATVVPAFKPSSADHSFTLGGIASGML